MVLGRIRLCRWLSLILLVVLISDETAWAQSARELMGLDQQVTESVARGDYTGALTPAQKLVAITKQLFGDASDKHIAALSRLAAIQKARKDYGAAETLYRQLLALQARKLPPDRIDLSDALINIANLYAIQRKFKEAEPLYEQAITLLEGELDARPESARRPLLRAQAELTSVLRSQNRALEADRLSRRFSQTKSPIVPGSLVTAPGLRADADPAPSRQEDKKRAQEAKLPATAYTEQLRRGVEELEKSKGVPVSPTQPTAPQQTKNLPPNKPAQSGTIDVPPDSYGVAVLFATDRQEIKQRTEQITKFTSERGKRLLLGKATVTVPRFHYLGHLERPWEIKVPFTNMVLLSGQEDPALHFRLLSVETLTKEMFANNLLSRINSSKAFAGQVLIFVHGYNTSFEAAMYRAAQIAFDLEFDGAPLVYSWPAGGGYVYDRDSARQSVQYFQEFLDIVMAHSGKNGINIIAHSMGNLPLVEMLKDLSLTQNKNGSKINQIILAAPDVDRDVFESLARQMIQSHWSMTLYASANDIAMQVSRQVAGGVPRAGDVTSDGPVITNGIDTIDVTPVGTEILSLNHSTYAEGAVLINDIKLLLLKGVRPPHQRTPIITPVKTALGTYWKFPGQTLGPREPAETPPYMPPPKAEDWTTISASTAKFVVHVASERSRDEALSTYMGLKNVYAALLKLGEADIIEVKVPPTDLPYRLRIGPPRAHSQAEELCRDLRSAGLKWCSVVQR
jgi:esterase/lipase superfamily enzyme